jgi:hypothetical protein
MLTASALAMNVGAVQGESGASSGKVIESFGNSVT